MGNTVKCLLPVQQDQERFCVGALAFVYYSAYAMYGISCAPFPSKAKLRVLQKLSSPSANRFWSIAAYMFHKEFNKEIGL